MFVQPDGLKRNSPRATPRVSERPVPFPLNPFALKGRDGQSPADRPSNAAPRRRSAGIPAGDWAWPCPVTPFQGLNENRI
jgi:hypothetical protein